MKDHKKQNQKTQASRRNFLTALSASSAGILALPLTQSHAKVSQNQVPNAPLEWRNKQAGMAYRKLGRTGMMISEVVNGGDPVRKGKTRPVEIAMERGLNYLDMAPAYGNGECEETYAQIIDSSSKREKVFMTTKVSGFTSVRSQLYRDIYDGLPSAKQEAILKKAWEIRAARGVDKPGYFLTYWPGQQKSNDPTFLANAMVEEYGHKVDGSQAFKDKIKTSVEGSLKRAKTDYFDILMCPHGANCAEEVQIPEINETFEELKKEGKVRYLGVSSHNDPAGVLRAATDAGKFDVVMCAYNVINGGYLEDAIRHAYDNGVGVIAMKAAMAVATHHEAIKPIPNWRIEKVNRIVPGEMKAPVKAYLWALQNPKLTAVISNLWDENFINDNFSVVGKKVELQPG
ncbi:aldo/keto reductase [Flexithrix dorotheae]|uniref:aldo/keto reductase n=1 Tax=Flexithrix dorotheae TaxID=70993 RepID=UPI000364680D|nr:aldo/keto reductase [Flexithrix dorotheae]